MPEAKPTVYLLYGDDDLAASEFVARLRDKLGDASTADMNVTRFSGASTDLGALAEACSAFPFLAPRRLVILEHPSRMMGDGAKRERFLRLLDSLPSTTALVLLEPADLKAGSAVLSWCEAHPQAAFVRRFESPRGAAFVAWVRQRCRTLGGEIEPAAAHLLAESVAEDAHQVDQELAKLLDYVDRRRPIEPADVERLTPFHGQSDVFAMVDALGQRDARQALQRLHRLLEDEDARYAFSMIVRQFRLLLLAREAIDQGITPRQVLGLHPYVADKVATQARNFSRPGLERIYHQLLDLDLGAKTSQVDLETSLDSLLASLAA